MQVHSLNYVFGNNTVFSDFNFSLPSKLHAITGKNGSGKTTLLKILGGVYRVQNKSVIALCHGYLNSLLYLSVSETFVDYFSILDHLFIYKHDLIHDWKQSHKKISKDLEISHLMDVKIKDLSTGEAKKALFLFAMLLNKKFICIDEPFESVDALTHPKMMAFLQNDRIKDYIVISSHSSNLSRHFTITSL